MTFNNTAQSDFIKLFVFPDDKKETLINFASSDFISLRDSLVDYIKAVYPLEYDYFVESDLGMMLIELVAYMGAVMSLKADLLANENYLLTARDRNSIRKLFELIGIKLKGPLSSAAEATLTFPTAVTGSDTIITIQNRTITVKSPEDGGSLAFTLYKTVNGVVDISNDSGQIVLSPAESVGSAGSTWTNLVLQEGALVSDEGEFAATESIKTIPLTESPVVEGSVEVYIDSGNSNASGAYTEVDNIFFASSVNQKIYQVVYDDEYRATVVFGNGIRGIIPPDDSSYFVTYRVGGGSRGNIVSNYINSNITAQGGRGTGVVTNTTPATGGSDAETTTHAKRYGPLTFARQDRVVTLEDYTVFANTFISDYGTVGKATAVTRKAYCSGNIIDIYVLEKANDLQVQKASPTFKQQLISAFQTKKMVTDEVVVVDGLVRTIDLSINIKVDRKLQPKEQLIKSKVRNVVLNFMAVDNREFGETLVISDLNRVIFELEEVRISSVDNILENIKVEFNELIQLNNLLIKIEYLD
jgi:hypothetical protein